MRIVEIDDKEMEKMEELGVKFKERFGIIELLLEFLVHESITAIESDGKYEEKDLIDIKARANDIAAQIFDDSFVNRSENDASDAMDTLFNIANSAVCAELTACQVEKESLGLQDCPQVNQEAAENQLKAKAGDRIKIIEDVAYGSIFGVIRIANGTTLTVKERNGSNDGINAEETITFNNEWLGNTVMPYSVWDRQYVVLK